MPRLVGVVAAAAIALAGCGGGNSATAAPKRVALAFYAALSAHDGARACSMLAPRARQFVAASGHAPCARAILARVRFPLGRRAKVGFIVAEGGQATLEIRLGKGPTAKLALVEQGGRWQVIAFA